MTAIWERAQRLVEAVLTLDFVSQLRYWCTNSHADFAWLTNAAVVMGIFCVLVLSWSLPPFSATMSSDAYKNGQTVSGPSVPMPRAGGISRLTINPSEEYRAMLSQTTIYTIPELPDPASPYSQLASGNDLAGATGHAWGELLRMIADSPPSGGTTATLRHVYDPSAGRAAAQNRLRIDLIVRSLDAARHKSLSIQIERGPLSSLYRPIRRDGEGAASWEEMKAVCRVARNERVLTPLITKAQNPAVPPCYHLISPFVSRRDGSFLEFDRVLDALDEPTILEVAVCPVEVMDTLEAYGCYLDQLHRIDRPPRSLDDLARDLFDFPREGIRPTPVSRPPDLARDPLAGAVAHAQQSFLLSLAERHVRFSVSAWAPSSGTAELIASVFAEQAFDGGAYRLLCFGADAPFVDRAVCAARAGDMVDCPTLETLFPEGVPDEYERFRPLGNIATIEELSGTFRVPVASESSPRTIRKETNPPVLAELVALGWDESIDQARSPEPSQAGPRIERGLPLPGFATHLFATGIPGSGKTSTLMNLAIGLWRRDVPCLILESTKQEYRALKTLQGHPDPDTRRFAESLRLYTPGDERISPARLNPLLVPDGCTINQRIQALLRIFKATMPLEGPLLALLNESLHDLYATNTNSKSPPLPEDLLRVAERVLHSKKYAPDVESTLRGALDVRLRSTFTLGDVGRIFRTTQNEPSVESLFTAPTLIELDALDPDQAALVIMTLLADIREYLRTQPYPANGPRLVILLEEAHLLVGRNRTAVPADAIPDTAAYASQYFCRMLAEWRAFGVGVIVCDQLPSAVAPEVVKNTASTLCLRQKDAEERAVMSSSMLMSSLASEDLVRLPAGRGYLMIPGYHAPRRIRLRDIKAELGIQEPPPGLQILSYLANDGWFAEAFERRRVGEIGVVIGYLGGMSDFLEEVKQRLMAEEGAPKKSGPEAQPAPPKAGTANKELRALRAGLAVRQRDLAKFLDRNHYLLSSEPGPIPLKPDTRAHLEMLTHRATTGIPQFARELAERVDKILIEGPIG